MSMNESEDGAPAVTSYIADAGTATRLTRAWIRYAITRPRSLLFVVVLALALIAYSAFIVRSTGSIAAVIVIEVLVLGFALFRMRASMRKNVRRLFPVGSEYSVGVGDSALVLWGPTVRSTIEYGTYRDVHIYDEAVVLQQRASRIVNLLPRELFPNDTAQIVRAKVLAAHS